MSEWMILLVIVAGAATVFGCRQSATTPSPAGDGPQAEYRKLTAQEAKVQLDADRTIVLVDVRTEAEYAEQRLAKSLLIPDYDIVKLAPTRLPDKAAKIFVYCRSGRRSHGAALALLKMGYTDVTDIGGIMSWPYATISGKPSQ
jgi:phage shock protein E